MPEVEVEREDDSAGDGEPPLGGPPLVVSTADCPGSRKDGHGVRRAIKRGGDGRNRGEPHEDRGERDAQNAEESEKSDHVRL
jgi:hypothetical protein